MKYSTNAWIVRLVILAVLLGVVGAVHWKLGVAREALQVKQERLRQAPLDELAAASLRSELRRSQAEITEALLLLPTREQVVDVVTAIEEEGKRRGITAAVLDIEEREEEGQPQEVLEEVELHLSASGNPSELLEFLYAVEHLPYVLHGKDWRLTMSSGQSQLVSSGLLVPTGGPQVVPQAGVAALKASIVLVVRSELPAI